jgi:hypothetical protein
MHHECSATTAGRDAVSLTVFFCLVNITCVASPNRPGWLDGAPPPMPLNKLSHPGWIVVVVKMDT